MDKIDSFQVNHLTLMPGLYVSRKDERNGSVVTTFDMRFTMPNREPVMETAPVHTVEHLAATFLRNSNRADEVVYFGPMGCRTGFYLIMFGDLRPQDVFELVCKMCEFICNFDGEIPGAKPEECGNYSDQDLDAAKAHTKKYLVDLVNNQNFKY